MLTAAEVRHFMRDPNYPLNGLQTTSNPYTGETVYLIEQVTHTNTFIESEIQTDALQGIGNGQANGTGKGKGKNKGKGKGT